MKDHSSERSKAIRFMRDVRHYIGDVRHDALYYDDHTHRSEPLEERMTLLHGLKFLRTESTGRPCPRKGR